MYEMLFHFILCIIIFDVSKYESLSFIFIYCFLTNTKCILYNQKILISGRFSSSVLLLLLY